MTNKQVISNEDILIKKYYRLSELTNRYVVIVISLLLSVLIFSTNMNSSNNIQNTQMIASSNILNTDNNVNVWLNTDNFNNRSKYIKSSLMLSKSYVQGTNINLWIWIFTNKKGTLYMPMNIILPNKYDINSKNFILFLMNWLQRNKINTIKPLKTTIKLNISELSKKYNLSCVNTIFNNSLFCNLNKKVVVSKLIKQKYFELSKSAYNYLFKNLPYSQKKKCNIIKKIFNVKYNLDDIKDIAKKYCQNIDSTNYNNMLKTMDIYNTILWKNLFNTKISSYSSVALTKLSQQQFNLINNGISYSKILINIKTIRELIDNWDMTKNIAIITKRVLQIILKKSINNESYKNIKWSILRIENGNHAIWEDWLNDLIPTTKNIQKNNSNYIIIKNTLHSQKELINDAVNNSYKNIFTVTNIKYNQDTKISHVEWYLNLDFNNKSNWKIINKKIKIWFILTNLMWNNFNIKDIKIKNEKINKYINNIWYNINKENTLLWLKKYLEQILYSPMVLNNYNIKNNISICDKVKQYMDWWTSCSSWIIISTIRNNNIEWWLNLVIKLNNSLLINSIKINKKNVKYKNKTTIMKEILELNLSPINKWLQSAIWDKLTQRTLSIIKSFVKKDIKDIKNKKIKNMVWMSDANIITLTQIFKGKLWAKIQLIRHMKWDFYKVYFNILGNTFIWIYSYSKNEIIHLWLLVKDGDNYQLFLFKNIDLFLSNNNIEKLNQFKLEPLNTLKNINPKIYNEYTNYIKQKVGK